MGKRLDTAKAAVDLVSVGVNVVVAVLDVKRRRREEERKAADEEKDRKIRDLERQVAELNRGRA